MDDSQSRGELLVTFYDDPRQTLEGAVASVVYTTRSGQLDAIADDFAAYLDRVCTNLGPGTPRDWLRSVVATSLQLGLTKATNVAEGDNYAIRLVPTRGEGSKRCFARFDFDGQVFAEFSWGGEDYYAPMSCLAFLQYLVDTLSEEQLRQFSGRLSARVVQRHSPDGPDDSTMMQLRRAASWFVLHAAFDEAAVPDKWVFSEQDLAANSEMNGFFAGELGCPVPEPALSWGDDSTPGFRRFLNSQLTAGAIGPAARFFPDGDELGVLTAKKAAFVDVVAKENGEALKTFCEERGRRLHVGSVPVDLGDVEVVLVPRNYGGHLGVLARLHPDFASNAGRRLDYVGEHLVSVLWTDPSELPSLVQKNAEAYIVSAAEAKAVLWTMTPPQLLGG